MKKSKTQAPVLKGNIVETTMIGNTTVHVCDDFIVTDPDEIERVLDEYYAAGWAMWRKICDQEGSAS
ncbi:hypothetical protein J19TS2_31300 [Cohnella xylanilytica]|uniref:hypothetical protein n=1 Tax=Cohnella xylanilytica TaxID=557555 RepID=UPI001B11A3E1|nr:hypothetical protein [Cohnella xylanilytica]GIO13575.1 hypothetical protein J19TS2_31300 [Cohnella xylanilytica]